MIRIGNGPHAVEMTQAEFNAKLTEFEASRKAAMDAKVDEMVALAPPEVRARAEEQAIRKRVGAEVAHQMVVDAEVEARMKAETAANMAGLKPGATKAQVDAVRQAMKPNG